MASLHRVEISSDGSHPGATQVYLNGTSIANMITSLHLDVSVMDPTELILSLANLPYTVALDDVNVRIDDEARDFLTRIGWTPPPEEATHELD